MRKFFIYRAIVALFIGVFLSLFFYFRYDANSAPLLANYFLNQLPSDNASLDILAKNNLLVITPAQALSYPARLRYIRQQNPSIIILAYVPSQSYNTKYWPSDSIYKDFKVDNSWWLRNSRGQILEFFPTLAQTNMSQGFSDYLINFTNQRIASLENIDGVFFDMVSEAISWSGETDIDNNGLADDKKMADSLWADRVEYFLRSARQNLKTKYIVINGNSNPRFQPYINGRMFESFPASWDWSGDWGTIMNYLTRGAAKNAQPKMVIINSGTKNTGNKNDFRAMRFGLASSLMEDNVYYSFDHGENDHGQLWTYDEYNISLGNAAGKSFSPSGASAYNNNVWLRNYDQGLAVVNASNQPQTIDLGSDYEKIIGQQDPYVNDGSIVSKITLAAKDAILMRKTAQNVYNVPVVNGSLVRFFDMKGARARNGFFSFVDGAAGGARVYVGDLDGKFETKEKIVAGSGKMEIFNQNGARWFAGYPFGGGYVGEIRYGVGLIDGGQKNIVVSAQNGSGLTLYNYFGQLEKENVMPYGKKYAAGFYVSIGNFDGAENGEVLVGSGGTRVGEVIIYDKNLEKVKYRFYPFDKKFLGRVKVAAGDVNGDGKDEVITMGKFGTKNVVRVFDYRGKKLSEFSVSSPLGSAELNIGTSDVNFDGRFEVVIDGN